MEVIDVRLFGNDPKVQKMVGTARNVAVTKAPLLIVGEVGVGKRTLARFVHQNSSRSGGPFRVVDCAEDAKEVENNVLGYRDEEMGRFNKGALELANGGTVVLAGIDCLEEDFQKRLHTILGELQDYDIDVRIVATTTKNLSKLVGAGRFYRGLYMLLSGNAITIPPLRERVQDLEMLARHFAVELSGNEETAIEDEAMEKILKHYWTHNVYELKVVVESAIGNWSMDGLITESDLEIGEKKAVGLMGGEDDSEGIRLMSLKDAEKILIKKALIHTSENRTQAAKILGVSIRTLRNKINEYRSGGSTYFVNLR